MVPPYKEQEETVDVETDTHGIQEENLVLKPFENLEFRLNNKFKTNEIHLLRYIFQQHAKEEVTYGKILYFAKCLISRRDSE